jgi:hypothetical protein
MTDLLSSSAPAGAVPAGKPSGPGLVAAAVAGVTAAGAVLLLTVALALAGWFAADAGRYGSTTDAVRVGADAWLMAHGAALRLPTTTVTVPPLGLTVLCLLSAYRAGRWARARSAPGPRDGAAFATVAVLATAYATTGLVVAVLAAHPVADVHPLRAAAGTTAVAVVAAGAGVLRRAGTARGAGAPTPGRMPPWLSGRLPGWLSGRLSGCLATARVAALATTGLLLAVGAALVAVALVLDFGTAATVLSRLGADGAGGLMYTLVGLAFVPNAVLLAVCYLLGPGFAVGTGTVVSPTAVVLGPVPAFPLLAALPADEVTPAWATWLVTTPVLVAFLAAFLAGRARPAGRADLTAAGGLLGGLLAAAVLALLVLLAGGAAGPGRMAHVGAPTGDVLLAAASALGGGGLLGGLVAGWRDRRRQRTAASTPGTGAG